MVKRLFDLCVAIPAVVLLVPVLILVAVAIKLDSPGPVFFGQVRVGRHGDPFTILKFRTMVVDAEKRGLRITAGRDPRITRVGAWLRRWKVDELPQLFNVVAGTMSLVGPRPEVAEYVALYPEDVRKKVLSVRPGITDSASIAFRDEEGILQRADDAERAYVEEILPCKLLMYEEYVDNWSLTGDLRLIALTIRAIVAA